MTSRQDAAGTVGAGEHSVVVHDPQVVATPVSHHTQVADDGAFMVATCTCGWRSYARRSRPKARAEAHDHEVLHRS